MDIHTFTTIRLETLFIFIYMDNLHMSILSNVLRLALHIGFLNGSVQRHNMSSSAATRRRDSGSKGLRLVHSLTMTAMVEMDLSRKEQASQCEHQFPYRVCQLGYLLCETVPCDSMTSGFVSDLFTVRLDDRGQTMLVICLQFTVLLPKTDCRK